MAYTHYSRSVPEIFTDVVQQLGALLRTEGELARAEVSQNIVKAGMGLAFVMGGAVLLIPALVVLLQAIVMVLAEDGMSTAGAAALSGGVVLIVGVILLFVGVNRLKPDRLVPSRTLHQIQRDVSAAKEQIGERDELHRAA